MSVKLQPAPKCETPAAFRGLLVKKLKVGQDLHCDTPLQPLLELKPDQDQVNYAAYIQCIFSSHSQSFISFDVFRRWSSKVIV